MNYSITLTADNGASVTRRYGEGFFLDDTEHIGKSIQDMFEVVTDTEEDF